MSHFNDRKINLMILFFIVTLICSGVLIINNTYSWFTSKDEITNRFSTGQLDFSVGVVDVFDPDNPWKPLDNKKVTAKNYGTYPAFVRILVQPVMMKEGAPLKAEIGQELITNIKLYDSVINPTGKWLKDKDDYYYYLDLLNPGEVADPYLFTDIKLSDGLPDDYKDANLLIQVKVEAINALTYAYRDAWWNNISPLDDDLKKIDDILKTKVKD